MRRLFSHQEPRPDKTCAVVRIGALGDGIQASGVLPYLKEQGYHVTFYTVPFAYEGIKHDPHVDRFIVQDIDAIPNEELGDFWAHIEKKYDRFINLSESVERSLLAMDWNRSFYWSHEMRHKHLNKNYASFAHDIAGVPLPSKIKFYPTGEERSWAQNERQKIGGLVVLWVLAGSAVHKVWPHVDEAMDAILKKHPGVRFVLVGDKDCQKLEAGWEDTPQVIRRSGIWSIRQTLSFAQTCDLVIGPETGVLNAVALEHVKKIVLLSHSSVENLTKDWVNCTSLYSKKTPCYPCHRLHMVKDGFRDCKEHEKSGIAQCQFDIPASEMVEAIEACVA